MSALRHGGFGGAVVAGGVVAVAEQALEPRAPLDRADGVARRALRAAQGVEPLAEDLGGARADRRA